MPLVSLGTPGYRKAACELAAMGAEAVEPLVEVLCGIDFLAAYDASRVLRRIGLAAVVPLTRVLRGAEEDARCLAVITLSDIGDEWAIREPLSRFGACCLTRIGRSGRRSCTRCRCCRMRRRMGVWMNRDGRLRDTSALLG